MVSCSGHSSLSANLVDSSIRTAMRFKWGAQHYDRGPKCAWHCQHIIENIFGQTPNLTHFKRLCQLSWRCISFLVLQWLERLLYFWHNWRMDFQTLSTSAGAIKWSAGVKWLELLPKYSIRLSNSLLLLSQATASYFTASQAQTQDKKIKSNNYLKNKIKRKNQNKKDTEQLSVSLFCSSFCHLMSKCKWPVLLRLMHWCFEQFRYWRE